MGPTMPCCPQLRESPDLAATAAVRTRVTRVLGSPDGSASDITIQLGPIGSAGAVSPGSPAPRPRISGDELLRPFEVHRGLWGGADSSVRAELVWEAACGLRESRVPIRVRVGDDGRVARPRELTELDSYGPGRRGRALSIDVRAAPQRWIAWARELAEDPEAVERWASFLGQRRTGYAPDELRRAVDVARRATLPRQEQEARLSHLSPCWPLVELCAGLTVTLLEAVPHGCRWLHYSRDGLCSPGVESAIAPLVPRSARAGHGEQRVLVAVQGPEGGPHVLVVARDVSGRRGTFAWCDTAMDDRAFGFLETIRSLRGRNVGYEVVSGPEIRGSAP